MQLDGPDTAADNVPDMLLQHSWVILHLPICTVA